MIQMPCCLLLLLVVLAESAIVRRNSLEEADNSPYIKHKETKHTKNIYLGKYEYDNDKYCTRPAKCQDLNFTTCMGAKLPYDSTTLDLTDLNSQEKVQERLNLYQYIRFLPKCWSTIQPFLCALYMPNCQNNTVYLPSREMCERILEPCKLIYNADIFPEYLKCDNKRLFPSKCKNDVHEMKFNHTGYCMDPLIKTDQPDWFYPDVEGCGLRCKDSLYTENEHLQIHKLIAYCVVICIIMNLFTCTTFMIDWNTGNKYPALAIFYVNMCYSVSYFGWLVQFLGNETREDIVCKKDGTLRKSEPSASENLSCVIVFVMIYYFFVAGLVWFVIFTYAWHMSSLQALGKIQERVDKKRAYFHLVAWSLPLILTITTMAIGEIDGDYVTGICFVGFVNRASRTGLLLVPLATAMITSGCIIIRGLILLIKVKIESRNVIPLKSSRKIRSNIVRMSVFTIFMVVFCVITFGYHTYVSQNSESWSKSLHNYIVCKLTSLSTDYSHCKQESRPSVAMLQLQLIAVFGSGIAMASWVWCGATLHSWGRYIRRKFHCQKEEPIKLQKHKIIRQAYAKRDKFNKGGRISIVCDYHTDPVGLKFELDSDASSNDLTTTFAAHLPRLINRRGAVPNEVTYSGSSNNQSMDSELSLNVRHVSIESRRNSGDSQLSVQIAELKATRKVNRHRHRNNFRSKSGNIRSKRKSKYGSKRESSTSLDSHMQVINAITGACSATKGFGPNLDRRPGNAGLDNQHISNFFSSGKIRSRNGSEDENVSVTISESTYRISNHNNFDLNDQFLLDSLRHNNNRPYIEEILSSSESDDVMKKDGEQEKRYSKCGRDSRSSKKSKRSKVSRKKYSSNSESFEDKTAKSDSSSCNEIKQIVQSSLNSGASVGGERNRGSRQSKTSIDVAVQADAQDIMNQTAAFNKTEDNDKEKSKLNKTKENSKFKGWKARKEKYKKYGSSEELKSLNDWCGTTAITNLIENKGKPKIIKTKD